MTPTALSLRHLKEQGYTAAVVEHWNSFARIRQDLFGVIDLVAVKAGEPGVLGIQTTTASNQVARLDKARQEPRLSVWLAAGNRFEVWGWGRRGRGERVRHGGWREEV